MKKDIRKFIKKMDLNPPATEESLKAIETKLKISFPAQYRDFILESNGAEGPIGKNSHLIIWPVEEIIQLNEGREEFTPGLVHFGSDGGGEGYAFDKRVKEMPIVKIPTDSINIDEDAELCGNTFNEFLQHLFNYEYEETDDEITYTEEEMKAWLQNQNLDGLNNKK